MTKGINDTPDAGARSDPLSVPPGGLPGDDELRGDCSNDDLRGGDGDDTLWGGDGNDTLWGGDGNDTVYGGTGADRVAGNKGDDRLDGGAGNDTLIGGLGSDTFVFGKGHGNDTIQDFGTDDWIDLRGLDLTTAQLGTVIGGATASDDGLSLDLSAWGGGTVLLQGIRSGDIAEADLIAAESAQLSIIPGGTPGHDQIRGGCGSEKLRGGDGDDTLWGGSGDDGMWGQVGNDAVYGGSGNDRVAGNKGDDLLDGGTGNDTLIGGPGSDTFMFSHDHGNDIIQDFGMGDRIDLRALAPTTAQLWRLIGDATVSDEGLTLDLSARAWDGGTILLQGVQSGDITEADFVIGGNDQLSVVPGGLPGDDKLEGGCGNDNMRSGDGNDTLWGGCGNDNMWGQVGNDTVYGGAGNDRVAGNKGDDLLDGGTGNDLLIGGPGSDTFVFGNGHGSDTIQDFGTGDSMNLTSLDLTRAELGTVIAGATVSDKGLTLDLSAWGGGTILLQGVQSGGITEADFVI